MSRHSSLLLEGFIVAIEISMSRQRIAIKVELVSRHIFFYVLTKGVGCRSFLCHYREWPQHGLYCRDREVATTKALGRPEQS